MDKLTWRIKYYFKFLIDFPKIVKAFYYVEEKRDFLIIFAHQLLWPLKINILRSSLAGSYYSNGEINVQGLKFKVLTNEIIPINGVTESVIVNNECEYKEVKVSGVVFDCGAHIGLFTVKFGKIAHIYAFEPSSKTRTSLVENLKLNSIKAEVIAKAVGDKNGTDTLMVGDGIANFLIRPNESFPELQKEEVEVITLDTFIKQRNLIPDFIKIDVEGADARVIKGAERIIREYKPKLSISIEHKPNDFYELLLMIKKINPEYKFYVKKRKIDWCLYAF